MNTASGLSGRVVARMAPERVRDGVPAGTFTALVLLALVLLASVLLASVLLASVFCAWESPVDVLFPGGRGGGERWDLSDMRNCVREADAG